MLRFTRFTDSDHASYSAITLPLDLRIKSRQKVLLDNGEEAGLFLPRGSVMKHGDRLQAESGEVIDIIAASETVSSLYLDDPLLIARACYHLGNRHVPLQINAEFIRYQHDHVLDDMLHGMGMHVVIEQAPFEPEAGAYHSHSAAGTHHHAH
jgi:urease accessory protein